MHMIDYIKFTPNNLLHAPHRPALTAKTSRLGTSLQNLNQVLPLFGAQTGWTSAHRTASQGTQTTSRYLFRPVADRGSAYPQPTSNFGLRLLSSLQQVSAF